ncbi:MAG: sigma-54-dependent Fis family transcriptional regulator [Proteobacteria bacterium]|nr:sigma-54-dependent Fis family transcriptional regulator [Pseudomonadota bacterium]
MTPNEMAKRLRHDLIKHLDIPKTDTPLSAAEAAFLLQRLFDSGSGACRLAAVWGFKLRKDPGFENRLDEPLKKIESLAADIFKDEKKIRRKLLSDHLCPPDTIQKLKAFADAVLEFERLCTSTPDMDEAAALDFFGLGSALDDALPITHDDDSHAATHKPPSKKIKLLVVDDRLMSIERLQAHPTFQARFTFATLCDETHPCARCPHKETCELKRARNYSDALTALSLKQNPPIDAILMDVRFDELSKEELLWLPELPHLNREQEVKALQGLIIARQLKRTQRFSHIPIIMMTAKSRLPDGAASLLNGLEGLQFVDDEASLDVLAARIESVIKLGQESPVEDGYFWGSSPLIQQTRRQIEIMSQGPRTVYLTGQSGSGKSALVEHIIFPLSKRKKLITLDLSAVPDTLVESELFGHVKGAYSGAASDRVGLIEEADGGVLFLDEIGNLSLENQRKILLFLQDKMVRRVGAAHDTRRHVDVKVVVATHLDLAKEVAAGRFRFDLYMRFGPAMRIDIPSLKERKRDLPQLVSTLTEKIAKSEDMMPAVNEHIQRCGAKNLILVDFASGLSPAPDCLLIRFKQATRELFINHAWPGNIRELESVLDTLILKALYDMRIAESKSKIIEIDHYYAMAMLGHFNSKSFSLEETHASAQPAPDIAPPHAHTEHAHETAQKTASTAPAVTILSRTKDFAELRQTLERNYLCTVYEKTQGDLTQMGDILFGDSSAAMKHKIAVRMNQLGIRLRALVKS